MGRKGEKKRKQGKKGGGRMEKRWEGEWKKGGRENGRKVGGRMKKRWEGEWEKGGRRIYLMF